MLRYSRSLKDFLYNQDCVYESAYLLDSRKAILKDLLCIHHSLEVSHKDPFDIHDPRTDSLMDSLYMHELLKDSLRILCIFTVSVWFPAGLPIYIHDSLKDYLK